jgi:hypothetical protein
MFITIFLFCVVHLTRAKVDFIEERGVVIVGEKTYHAALIEFNHLLFFYHNYKVNESNVKNIHLKKSFKFFRRDYI